MKLLKIIWFYIEWIFYFSITMEERTKYYSGQTKGMKCTEIKNDMFGTTITYDPNSKPSKPDYLTFKEFKAGYHPITGFVVKAKKENNND